MLDFIKTVGIVAIVIGLWVSIPIFAAIVGTGLALVVLHFLLKEYSDEQEKLNDHNQQDRE